MIIIGETGTGKSTLCNFLTGNRCDSKEFKVGNSKIKRGTEETTIKSHAFFLGDKNRPFTIIDTPGFNDPGRLVNGSRNDDKAIVNELMSKLSTVNHINLFVVCLNGAVLELRESMRYVLNYFRDIFGVKMEQGEPRKDANVFWRRCFIVVTKMHMDENSIKRRSRDNNNVSDEEIIEEVIGELASILKIDDDIGYAKIDALHGEDNAEKEIYNHECEELYQQLCKKHPAMTEAMIMAHNRSAKG